MSMMKNYLMGEACKLMEQDKSLTFDEAFAKVSGVEPAEPLPEIKKKFVYLQVFDRDIFDPQFYRTMREAREAMIHDFREQLLQYDGEKTYESLIKRCGPLIDIPSEWWDDGNDIAFTINAEIAGGLGYDYFWFDLPRNVHYDAKIIEL